MKKFIAIGALVLVGGCSAFTPGEVQDAISRLNQDLPKIRQAVAMVSTNTKILADIDIVSSNVRTMDAILNH